MHLPLFLIYFSFLPVAFPQNIFSTNTTIAHPESGLFLDYVGPYLPSQAVIHSTALFPMTASTCYLLPLSAAEKIPSCNLTLPRPKRLVPFIISLGVGALNLGLSVSNTIQMGSLQKEIALVEKSLYDLSQQTQIIGAQLVQAQSGQFRIVEQLQMTQQLIESTVPVINDHSQALNTLQTQFSLIQTQMQNSFLYQAIIQIFRNDLTLAFFEPHDLHRVVYDVIHQGNLTFNPHFGSLPLAHIVTQLLIRQQLDFIPSSNYQTAQSSEIGRLVITSYFAVPRSSQSPFLVYKLITTPFIHQNRTFQLAQTPKYLAIEPTKNVTIEWSDQTDSACDFSMMTTCRNTPPFRSLSSNDCLGQILNGLPLSKCAIAPIPPSPFFLRQLRDNLWVTSSPQSLHCVIIPKAELLPHGHQHESRNEQLILPPVALVNVTPETTIACPGFSLIGRPMEQETPSVVILYNNTLFLNNISVMDIHHHLTRGNRWFKTGFAGHEVGSIVQSFPTAHSNSPTAHSHPMYFPWMGMLIVALMLTVAVIIAVIHIRKKYPTTLLHNLRVTVPTLSLPLNTN